MNEKFSYSSKPVWAFNRIIFRSVPR